MTVTATGPIMTMNSDGIMNNTSGNIILVDMRLAVASARCLHLTRI